MAETLINPNKGHGFRLVETFDPSSEPIEVVHARMQRRREEYIHELTCDIPLDSARYPGAVALAGRSFDRRINSIAMALGLPGYEQA